MKTQIFATVLFLLLFIFSFSQIPDISWQYLDGGSFTDYGRMIKKTNDNGFVIAGEYFQYLGDSIHPGKSDYWVLKFDENKVLEWEKFYGGSEGDLGFCIWQTSSNGYLVSGRTQSNNIHVSGHHGNGDIWLIKLNESGDLLWQHCYGGSDNDFGRVVIEMPNRDIILAGHTDSDDGDVSNNHGSNMDIWVLRLDLNGEIIWENCYGGFSVEWFKSLHPTSDGGFIISGRASSNDGQVITNYGSRDVWVIKINTQGTLQWQKVFGTSGDDKAGDAIQTSDGGYLVACAGKTGDGNMPVNYGRTDYWLIKLSASGYMQWQQVYGGSNYDEPENIIETPSGDFIISGTTQSNDGHISNLHGESAYKDIWVICVSSSGELIWEHCYGGSNGDYVFSTIPYSESYLVTGYTWSHDGDIIGDPDQSDMWVIELSETITNNNKKNFESQLEFFPNPANDHINLLNNKLDGNYLIKISSISGKQFTEINLPKSTNTIDISNLESGVYLLSVIKNNKIIGSRKLIKH